MNKLFQEARDFAGADWEKLKVSSRIRLLESLNQRHEWAYSGWSGLAPTVKKALAMSLLKEKK